MQKDRGLFIAVSGPNAVGKSRAVGELQERLRENGKGVKRLKFPNYDRVRYGLDIWDDYQFKGFHRELGGQLDAIFHGGYRIPAPAMQRLCVADREDMEEVMWADLRDGTNLLVEGWLPEAVVYGQMSGLSRDEIYEMNEQIMKPDLTFVLLGPIYFEARQREHPFESKDPEVVEREVVLYREAAEENGWAVIELQGETVAETADKIWPYLPERLTVSDLPW